MTNHPALKPNNPDYPNILFYLQTLNRFMDHQWCIVHDLHELFDTWQLDDWKNKARNDYLTTRAGDKMLVYFLTDDEEDSMFDYFGNEESYGVKIDRRSY